MRTKCSVDDCERPVNSAGLCAMHRHRMMNTGTINPPPWKATPGLSGADAAKELGVTYRQLDYWARTIDALSPSIPAEGSGRYRLYTEADLVRWRLFVSFVKAGMTVAASAETLVRIEEEDIDMERAVVTISDGVVAVGEAA